MDVTERIVVGVDGSRGAEQALQWAAEEGRLRGAEVCALLAWSFLDQHAPPGGLEFTSQYSEDDARRALAAYVARALPGGDHPVRQCVVNELPRRSPEAGLRTTTRGVVVRWAHRWLTDPQQQASEAA